MRKQMARYSQNADLPDPIITYQIQTSMPSGENHLRLTDAEWTLVAPFLPPAQRVVVSGHCSTSFEHKLDAIELTKAPSRPETA